MIEFEAKETAVSDESKPELAGVLPYIVEFRDTERRAGARVLARAANASLAHAIFRTACEENPERDIVLRLGSQIVVERAAKRPS
jgi:hypothetical protein